MRRFAILLAALLALCCTALAEAPAPLTDEDFTLDYEGVTYRLGEDAAPLLSAMTAADGAAPDVFEAESCLFEGMDREYTGNELLIATCPTGKGGADQLETFVLLGGDTKTARGVGLGASLGDVEAAYGTSYTRDGTELTYAMGSPLSDPILIFTLDAASDTVIEILLMNNTGF